MLAGASPVTADQPVVEAEEIHTLATHGQLHDPGLGRLRFQTEIGQYRQLWEERLDRLEAYLLELQSKEKPEGEAGPSSPHFSQPDTNPKR